MRSLADGRESEPLSVERPIPRPRPRPRRRELRLGIWGAAMNEQQEREERKERRSGSLGELRRSSDVPGGEPRGAGDTNTNYY
jgi:hypothetical protein